MSGSDVVERDVIVGHRVLRLDEPRAFLRLVLRQALNATAATHASYIVILQAGVV